MHTRAWVISELYPPEKTATAHFLAGIAEGLAGQYRVGVLCARPGSTEGQMAPDHATEAGVEVFRSPSIHLNGDLIPFRLINALYASVLIWARALFQIRQGDVVIVVTNPPVLPFGIAPICWLRRAHCILLIHDVYPEALVAAGLLRPDGFHTRVFHRLTRILYRSVESIVVIGRDMRDLVGRKLGQEPERIRLIPNWADTDWITPNHRRSNQLLARLGLLDEFVVQYSGNMGRTHGLEGLLQVAESLRADSEFHLLFIGKGTRRNWLETTIRKRGLENVTLLPYRRSEELSDSLGACDLAVIAMLPGMTGVSVPSRVYNIMAAGKPILAIADEDSELAQLLREEGIGWIVPPAQTAEVRQVIHQARADRQLLQEMGSRARRVAENKCTRVAAIASYKALFRDMVRNGQPRDAEES